MTPDNRSSPSTRPASSDEELHQALKLMASADEVGNNTALAKVEELIGSSSNNSGSTLLEPAPPISSLPSSSEEPEIFVDASGFGIGFVFGTHWLAWIFEKTSKIPKGRNGNIVICWAELLGVELGLRALITGGYQSTNITIRSDNQGVIDALMRKTWCARYGMEEMLQNILDLCREYKITLIPRWISTTINPADMPSRGEFPPWSLVYNFPPKLPQRLSGLLKLATPPTA